MAFLTQLTNISNTFDIIGDINLVDVEVAWKFAMVQVNLLSIRLQDTEYRQLLITMFDENATFWLRILSAAANSHYSNRSLELQRKAIYDLEVIFSMQDPVVKWNSTSMPVLTVYMFDILLKSSQPAYLVSYFVDSFLKVILQSFKITSTIKIDSENDNESPALNLLSYFFSVIFHSKELLTCIHETSYEILLNLLVKILIIPSSQTRDLLIRRSLSPLLKIYIENESNKLAGTTTVYNHLVLLVWTTCLSLYFRKDYLAASSLLCSFITVVNTASLSASFTFFNPIQIIAATSHSSNLWQLVLHCFHHSDPTLRKRAAFILQSMPVTAQSYHHQPHLSETDSSHPIDSIAENTSHSKRISSNSKKGNNSSDPLSSSSSHSKGQKNKISNSNNTSSTDRWWWNDYLDIYHQAEGCSSLHLVNQAWPLMERLCYLASEQGEDDIDLLIHPSDNTQNHFLDTNTNTNTIDNNNYSTLLSSSEDILLQVLKSSSSISDISMNINADINEDKKCIGPKFSFSWIRVLFRLLLKSQIPSIRKTCLFKILSGQLRFAASTFIAEWITSELFQLIDFPLFFSTGYIPPGTDIGIAIAFNAPTTILISKDDDFAKRRGGGKEEELLVPFPEAVTSFDPLAHPGILMPRFLASIISLMSEKCRESQRKDFPQDNAALSCLLRGIIASVCGNEESGSSSSNSSSSSSTNGTRIMSMSSMSAMRWVMRTFACKTVDYHSYLPRCFTINELKLIRNFVKEKLACCNNAVRNQVLLGLSPLFLACVDPRGASSSGGDGRDGLLLLLEATEEIGWWHALRAGATIGHSLRRAVSAFLQHSEQGLTDTESTSSISHRPEDYYLMVKAGCLFSPSQSCSPNDSNISGYGGMNTISNLQNKIVNMFQKTVGLGSSPYTSMDTQRSVLFLTSGLTSVLQLVATNRKLAGALLGLSHLVSEFVKYLDDVCCFLVNCLREKVLYEDSTCLKALASLADVQVGWNALGGLLLLPALDLIDNGAPLDSVVDASGSISYGRLLLAIVSLLGELLDTMSACSPHSLDLPSIGILLLFNGLLKKLSSAWTMILRYVTKVTRTNTCQVSYELLLGVLMKTCKTLITLPLPSSTTFLAAQSEFGSGNDFTSTSSSLIAAIIAGCGHFGRLSALVMSKRWNAFRVALEMLTALQATVSRDNAKLSWDSQLGASRPDGQLARHGAEILQLVMDQLDVAATDSIPDILATAALACKYALEADHLNQCDANDNHGSSDRDNILNEIRKMLLVAWQSVLGTNEYSPEALGGFVLLLTSPILLTSLDPSLLTDYFEKIFVLSCADRPSLLQLLVRKLCDVWGNNPSAMFPFILTFIPKILLHREYIPDDHSIANWDDNNNEDEESQQKENIPVRIAVLSLLENLDDNNNSSSSNENDILVQQHNHQQLVKRSMQSLILHLLQLNVNGELSKTIILGSEKFGTKLRIWQALCILSKYLDENLLQEESEGGNGGAGLVFQSLRHNCPHAIRVHMELFTAELCRRFPRLILPTLLDGNCLNVFNHPQQTLSSYFVLLGHVVYSDKEDGVPARAANPRSGKIYTQKALSAVDCLQIVDSLLPWLTCVSGLPRAIAQLLGYELIPRIITIPEKNNTKLEVSNAGQLTSTSSMNPNNQTSIIANNNTVVIIEEGKIQLLYSIWKFLDTNIEVIKLRSKQILFFSEFELRRKLTVQGLLDLPLEVSGERVPVHILTLLGDAVKAQKHEKNASKKDGSDTADHEVIEQEGDNVESLTSTSIVLQSKRIPFDELHLNLPFLNIQGGGGGTGSSSALESVYDNDGGLNRHSGISKRKRQNVIVCASLLGKITNLAGIARTCEVFAVEKLLLNSLSVIETDDFKGIAVSCGAWLPMEEVPEGDIPQYLRNARAKGYVVVGLEQADGSKALGAADTTLPPKCVLLLGKEREGIPAELLAEIDICLEIPQFGVIRSLNVHVSAALAIWELTKRNLKSLS